MNINSNQCINGEAKSEASEEGLSPSPKLFNELMKGRNGFILTGEEAYESFNELERSSRPLNPKYYVSRFKTT
jgi:hypothetical protein